MDFFYLRSQDNKSKKGFSSPAYIVPTHRVIRVVSGEGVYSFPDCDIEVSTGSIFLTAPGERQIQFGLSEDVQLQVINFSAPDYWMDKSHIVYSEDGRSRRFMNELIEDLIYGAEKRKNTLLSVVIDLFAESGKIDDGGNKVVKDVAQSIKENPHLNYVVADVAKKCGCSESHFRAIFRKEMKMSPKAYIKKVKMEYAIHLMRDENMMVKQVADILGYNDIYEFSKQFKTVYGKPPTKLIKRKPATN
ncbi:MAG: AraC family transcriptional regulator [Lentisphaeraceae bacterium]|nr:AraC family transcriptional regulator [Lentisphaeraceae bacterium]